MNLEILKQQYYNKAPGYKTQIQYEDADSLALAL